MLYSFRIHIIEALSCYFLVLVYSFPNNITDEREIDRGDEADRAETTKPKDRVDR